MEQTEKKKIIVPLEYLNNFWRSLEMPLINCWAELSLGWIENCVLSRGENINNAGAVANAGTAATFKITYAKLYVPIVTLSTEDSVKLLKLFNEGFKRSVYWNKYKTILNKNDVGANGNPKYIRELLDPSHQGVKGLFVLAYHNTEGDDRVSVDSHQQYFLPRVKIESYNIKIDGRNFYDQPINDLIKQYDEIRKVSIGQGDDYTTSCLLDFAYFKKITDLLLLI